MPKLLEVPHNFTWNEHTTIDLEKNRDRITYLCGGKHKVTLLDLWQMRDIIEALMYFDLEITPDKIICKEKTE